VLADIAHEPTQDELAARVGDAHRPLEATRQTNGFLEALNDLFQAAKRKSRGYTRFDTMRTVIFLIAGKLDFSRLNPRAA